MSGARWTSFVAACIVAAGCTGGTAGLATEPVDPGGPVEVGTPTTIDPAPATAAELTTVATEPAVLGQEPACVVEVAAGDSLGRIATRIEDISLDDLLAENRIGLDTVIHPGDRLDVCIGNDVDDLTGTSRLAPDGDVVLRQQARLNELFSPFRLIPLVVDGDSGPLTRQMLCAARLGLGLPASMAHLAAEGPDAAALFEMEGLGVPDGAPTHAARWILIDQTCQVMFTGEGDRLVNIYPTSTGEPGHETRNGRTFIASRYDPALDTDGWHDSSNFPVAIDDPLNGNMYKPIYFNDGQAIHGANYVPPFPRSKGCARTFPLHQDELIAWLGIGDLTEATWRAADLDLTVAVQGEFRAID